MKKAIILILLVIFALSLCVSCAKTDAVEAPASDVSQSTADVLRDLIDKKVAEYISEGKNVSFLDLKDSLTVDNYEEVWDEYKIFSKEVAGIIFEELKAMYPNSEAITTMGPGYLNVRYDFDHLLLEPEKYKGMSDTELEEYLHGKFHLMMFRGGDVLPVEERIGDIITIEKREIKYFDAAAGTHEVFYLFDGEAEMVKTIRDLEAVSGYGFMAENFGTEFADAVIEDELSN